MGPSHDERSAGAADRTARSSSPVFIHDFVPLDESWMLASTRFTSSLTAPLLASLVVEAWNAEVDVAAAAGLGVQPCVRHDVEVFIGEGHRRHDAVVVPIGWRPAREGWVAPLEADLELAAFGSHRCHLHLLGRSTLPRSVEPLTTTASMHQRLTVAIVRHVLAGFASAAFDGPMFGPISRRSDPKGQGTVER